MFTKSILASALAVILSGAMANPVNYWPSVDVARRADSSISDSSIPSFDNYMGLSSMSNFDGFFGRDNFDGSQNSQTIIVQQEEIICQTEEIEIIQQKLVILVENIKRILLEQICEVEVQTIVVEQASNIISSFGNQISHQSKNQAAYDSNIAGMLGKIMNSDGSLSTKNLGFSGTNAGNSSVVVSGNNWNDTTSPQSVKKAKDLAQQAANSTSSS